ncbi:MAG: serine/threonine-protein kinase [Myxococcales bacterium]|nr:serine/threonine-protein kinase [Myxococcales bacterium]
MRPVRYQVLGPLHAGEGSRAQLGLAVFEDGRADPCVVVPVPDAAEKDAALLEKIKRETEHAAQLDHPNIVTVFGFGALGKSFARMVEFADGESLRRILNISKTLTPRLAARIVIEACTGVHYAHLAGNDDGTALVHGDVRPETILISFAGVTKVTGYGALAFAPKEIGGQRVKGRRVHSSPEQIIGGRDAITIPSDVYLLGLTFYELLTGAVPWADQGDGFDQAVLAYPLPPATPGLIPEALQTIIEKACQKKSAQRYPTPLAMREAIEAALPGDEIASTEELSKYLDSLFPGSGEIRAERKRTIDAGIAEYARQQWARRDTKQIPIVHLPANLQPAMPEQPPPPPEWSGSFPPQKPPPPPPVSGPQKPLKPAPTLAPPEPIEIEEEEPKQEGSSTPWVIFLLVIVVAASGYFAWTKANAPFQAPEPDPRNEDPTPVRTVETDAGTAVPVDLVLADAGDDADAGAVIVDAGAPVIVVIDAGPPAPVELAVTIESRPTLELTIDGNVVGKTPWTGRLPMGAHKLKLENKDLLISAGRTVTVQGTEPITQTYTFEKGTVGVSAPPGAVIFIDGKKQGVAPLANDLSIYEGYHRILVKVGQAQWTETFSLFAGQRVSFNVELE